MIWLWSVGGDGGVKENEQTFCGELISVLVAGVLALSIR